MIIGVCLAGMYPKFFKNEGYTLVELVVVVAIFGIIFAVMVAGFKSSNKITELRIAGDQLAAHIRTAQTQTLAGLVNQEIVASGGFGLYFAATGGNDRYLLFRDDGSNDYETGQDTFLETIALPENITINNLTEDPLSVVFRPPKPTIYFNGAQIINSVDIVLRHSNIAGKQARIQINRFTGQVYSKIEDY